MYLPSFTVILHWVQILISFYNLYLQNALPFAPITGTNVSDPSQRPVEVHVSSSSILAVTADRAVISVKLYSEGPQQDSVSEEVKTSQAELMRLLRPLSQSETAKNGSQTLLTPEPPIVDLSVNTFKANSHRRRSTIFGEKPIYEASIETEAEFADFDALGHVIAKLSQTPRLAFNWMTWKLKDETRDDAISRCQQDAARKLMRNVRDYTSLMGLEHVRAKSVRENRRLKNEGVVLSKMEADFGGHYEADFGILPDPHSVQDAIEFEPKTFEIRAELVAEFDVW